MPWRFVPPRAFWPRRRLLAPPAPLFVPPPLPLYPAPPVVVARRRWRRAMRGW